MLHLENSELLPVTARSHLWLDRLHYLSQKKAKILWIWSHCHPSSAAAHYFLQLQYCGATVQLYQMKCDLQIEHIWRKISYYFRHKNKKKTKSNMRFIFMANSGTPVFCEKGSNTTDNDSYIYMGDDKIWTSTYSYLQHIAGHWHDNATRQYYLYSHRSTSIAYMTILGTMSNQCKLVF